MNRSRRQRIEKAVDAYLARLEEIKEDLINVLSEVKDEEEEAYYNMPESLQDGEKGEAMQEAIDALDYAVSEIEEEPDFSELYEACGLIC